MDSLGSFAVWFGSTQWTNHRAQLIFCDFFSMFTFFLSQYFWLKNEKVLQAKDFLGLFHYVWRETKPDQRANELKGMHATQMQT